MARTIEFVLSNPDAASRMRQSGLTRSRVYSWDRTADIVFDTLRDVVAANASPRRSPR